MSRSQTHRVRGNATAQTELPLLPAQPLIESGETIEVLDLFAGIGGLSAGFRTEGFSVRGVDAEPTARSVYEGARFGPAHTVDLGSEIFDAQVPVVVGGPPCRPWSVVNLQRRRGDHEDYGLLMRFVEHVRVLRPALFVMENVPALGSDEVYSSGLRLLRAAGYDVSARILHYERFGAATRRRRLFTVGVRGLSDGACRFFDHLEREQSSPRTVREAIYQYREVGRGDAPDHDWSELKSIANYRERYQSGRYGWRQLEYDMPAPSFGSVAKTYILHPEAGRQNFQERVLSVREVLAIMGFDEEVRFPQGTPRAKRYQMATNAVSPQVSRAVAAAVKRVLTGSS